MQLQQLDPIFQYGGQRYEPAFNLEPKHWVTTLTREEWSRRPGTTPGVEQLIWFTHGSKREEGTGTGVYGQSLRRRLSISVGKYATVFQLVCMQSWPALMKFK
jgi:hypothetical protein